MPNKTSDSKLVAQIKELQTNDPKITIRQLIPKVQTSRGRLLDLEKQGLISIYRNTPAEIKQKIKNHRWSQDSKFHRA